MDIQGHGIRPFRDHAQEQVIGQNESSSPKVPPRAARSRLSVNNCRIKAPAGWHPIARRTGEFALATSGAREQKIRYVRASEQQTSPTRPMRTASASGITSQRRKTISRIARDDFLV